MIYFVFMCICCFSCDWVLHFVLFCTAVCFLNKNNCSQKMNVVVVLVYIQLIRLITLILTVFIALNIFLLLNSGLVEKMNPPTERGKKHLFKCIN